MSIPIRHQGAMADSSNISAVDSNMYRTIFGDDAMRFIMCDTAFEERMVQVEISLARIQANLGTIPKQAAEDIANDCNAAKLDRGRLQQETELVGLPVWGLVRQLSAMVRDETSARYLHGGLNTHDVMDLARSIQMKDALELICSRLDTIRNRLVALTHQYRKTPMVARTHLQHALPSTFGYRTAIWLTSLDRHAERLQQIKPRLLLAQVGGASGSLASLGGIVADSTEDEPEGLRLVRAISEELGLYQPNMPWHAARDGLAEVVSLLALIGGSLAKIALDIVLLQIPEVGEVAEPFVAHRGASSTMPHKNNPVLSEVILALSKMLRQEAGLALDAVPSDFERAGSGAWQLEWATLPQSFTYCSAALKHTEEVLTGLRVDEDRMLHNLNLSRGLVAAEHVVVALHEKYGRARSHDIVYECCRQAVQKNQDLSSTLKQREDVTICLSDADIDWYCDPANYLGLTTRFIDIALAGR
ncbi:3-carboxy-cis,cis-muconate cycloisomerase [Trichoderma afarasin]